MMHQISDPKVGLSVRIEIMGTGLDEKSPNSQEAKRTLLPGLTHLIIAMAIDDWRVAPELHPVLQQATTDWMVKTGRMP